MTQGERTNAPTRDTSRMACKWKRDLWIALCVAFGLGVAAVFAAILIGMHDLVEVCHLQYDGTGLMPVPDTEFDKGCDPKPGKIAFFAGFIALRYLFLPVFVLLHGGRWLVHGLRHLAKRRRGGGAG